MNCFMVGYRETGALFFPWLFFIFYLNFFPMWGGLGGWGFKVGSLNRIFLGYGFQLMGLGACGVWLFGSFLGWDSLYKRRIITKGINLALHASLALILNVGTIKVSFPLINCAGFALCHCIRSWAVLDTVHCLRQPEYKSMPLSNGVVFSLEDVSQLITHDHGNNVHNAIQDCTY